MSDYKRTKEERLQLLKDVERNSITISVRLNDNDLKRLHRLKESMQIEADGTALKYSLIISDNVLHGLFGEDLAIQVVKRKKLKEPKKYKKTDKMCYQKEFTGNTLED